MITCIPYGDSALLINFEQIIDEQVNQKVTQLAQTIQQAEISGITFSIPAYCSLTIGYDPMLTNFSRLESRILSLTTSNTFAKNKPTSRLLNIPVCYEPPYGLDFEELEAQTGFSEKAIIDLHTQNPFRVYMLGFLPGFTYMGKLPKALYCKRKTTPRLKVPARSVGLAGLQTGIYPLEAPGGWQIIGQTPLNIFDSQKEPAFLFQPGDQVRFYSVSVSDYHQMREAVTNHTFELKSIYG